jgi:hypothetical protein
MDTNSSISFDAKIAEVSTKLLMPFTSKETRSEGVFLVFLSFITALLSLKIISIEKASVSGLSIVGSDRFFVCAAGLVCLYYFILYCLDVYGDWKGRFFFEFEDIGKDMTAEIMERGKKIEIVFEKIGIMQGARDKKYEEFGLNEIPVDTLREYNENSTYEENKATIEKLRAETALSRKRLINFELFDQYCKDDGLDALRERHSRMCTDKTIAESVKLWLKNKRAIYRLVRVRFFVEVIFPVVFGILSILSAIRYIVT